MDGVDRGGGAQTRLLIGRTWHFYKCLLSSPALWHQAVANLPACCLEVPSAQPGAPRRLGLLPTSGQAHPGAQRKTEAPGHQPVQSLEGASGPGGASHCACSLGGSEPLRVSQYRCYPRPSSRKLKQSQSQGRSSSAQQLELFQDTRTAAVP